MSNVTESKIVVDAEIFLGKLELSGDFTQEVVDLSAILHVLYAELSIKDRLTIDPMLDLIVDLCTNVKGSMSDEVLLRALQYVGQRISRL